MSASALPDAAVCLAAILGRYRISPATGCWEWTAGRHPLGYGIVWIQGKCYRASRVAWAAHRGPIPAGQCALHHCDNPPCINPDPDRHVYLGTKAQNSHEMVAKGRSAAGERHSQAKLTASDVEEIRQLLAAGELTQTEIGTRFGVRGTAVSRIATGKRWAGRVAC
jgi:predicted XRE-type DNA-binding protein